MNDDLYIRAGIIATAALVLYAVLMTIVDSTTQARCMRAGYPDARVSWRLERYCVRRVNQTDVIVLLKDAGTHPPPRFDIEWR